MTVFEPGKLCWADLYTTDADAAERFYERVFGWETKPVPMPDGGTYVMLQKAGQPVAALYELSDKPSGVPPHWKCYVAVKSADESAALAAELDAQIIEGPIDVFDAGRMALIQDPTGAFLALWEGRRHPGAGLIGEPNTLCWMELLTRDTAVAADFYQALFGWQSQLSSASTPGEYIELSLNGRGLGGMMEIPAEANGMVPCWTPYFLVADLQKVVDATEEWDGGVCIPPTDIPPVGRFAFLHDPQGAVFAVIQPAPEMMA